jgi:hypothetical protein
MAGRRALRRRARERGFASTAAQLARNARRALLLRAVLLSLRAKQAYGSRWPNTASHRSWMLAERAFRQLASVTGKRSPAKATP